VAYVGSPENLAREAFGGYFPDAGSYGAPRKDNNAVFRERHARLRLADYQVTAIKWLAPPPRRPAPLPVISGGSGSRRPAGPPPSRRGRRARDAHLQPRRRQDPRPAPPRSRRRPRRQPRPDARVHEREERRVVGLPAGGRLLHPRLRGAPPLRRVPGHLP